MTIPPAEPGSMERALDLELLAAWMIAQRWYANKASLPDLEQIGSWELPSDEPEVRIVTHLVVDHTVGKPALYQVPITYRIQPLAAGDALIGESEGEYLYDAPHDPAYTTALLDLVTRQHEFDGIATWVRGHRDHLLGIEPDELVSRVLTGEQSNTSIIFEGRAVFDGREGAGLSASPVPVIFKVFRALHHGENPDVELQTALAAAGSQAVPRPLGHVLAEWNDRGQKTGRALGHVGFAQEFLPGAEDAWRVATAAAERGASFASEAHALGVATAGVHATLASTLQTRKTRKADIAEVIATMHGRLASAIVEVPDLKRWAPAIRMKFDTAAAAGWPARQRIHGDLHLGQVLAVPGRDWVMVDFEGEPLRPMHERSKLESPLRDVAGMLRSFDYVAGSLSATGGADAAELAHWAVAARDAFEQGYSEASGSDLGNHRALVDAFELDKALYEVVYESRNRPDWIGIPVAAIERLASR